MPNVVKNHGGWGSDGGPVRAALPTLEQIDELIRVTAYSYEAGERPDGMSEFAREYTVGDGGLLNALRDLRYARALLSGAG